MILLTMRFLPGAHRITVVDAGPDHVIHAAFQYVRMSEFPAPVSEYQRERETELNRGDLLFQTVENCFYTFGLLAVKQESGHKGTACKVKGKKDLMAPFAADHGIHLYDRGIRMGLHILPVVVECAAFEYTRVFNLCLMDVADFISYFLGKIYVLNGQDALFYVVVESLFGKPDLRMIVQYSVGRLSLKDQGSYQLIQHLKIRFGNIDTCPGLHQNGPVLSECGRCFVIVFIHPAVVLFMTAVADKGSFIQQVTVVRLGDKVGTYTITVRAGITQLLTGRLAVTAEMLSFTVA
jgi:hypothetical protein